VEEAHNSTLQGGGGIKDHFPFVICHFSFSDQPCDPLKRKPRNSKRKWQMRNDK
jgi:hypothetical protein